MKLVIFDSPTHGVGDDGPKGRPHIGYGHKQALLARRGPLNSPLLLLKLQGKIEFIYLLHL